MNEGDEGKSKQFCCRDGACCSDICVGGRRSQQARVRGLPLVDRIMAKKELVVGTAASMPP